MTSAMPRPEKDIDVARNPMLAAFALEMRLKRARHGPSMTYRKLAEITHYNPSTLSKAISGKTRPSKAVTLALARALGQDEAYWERRWEETGPHKEQLVDSGDPARHPDTYTHARMGRTSAKHAVDTANVGLGYDGQPSPEMIATREEFASGLTALSG